MAHHTRQEAIDSLPQWRRSLASSLVVLDAAIETGDWIGLRNAGREIKFIGTNLGLRAADLQEHDAAKLNRPVKRTDR